MQKDIKEWNELKYKNICFFIIVFLISLLLCGNFVTMHFATDTYMIMDLGLEEYLQSYSIGDGRIFMALLLFLANIAKIPITILVPLFTVVAIIILSITVIILYKIIKNLKEPHSVKMDLLLLLISYISIFNFMLIENLYYLECIVMAISILFCILAGYKLVIKEQYIQTFILAILGVFCYQGTVNVLVTFSYLLLIIKPKKTTKENIISIFSMIGIFFVACLFNVIFIKVFGREESRITNITEIISTLHEKIQLLCFYIVEIAVNTANQFPKYALLSFILAYLVLMGKYFKKYEKLLIYVTFILISFIVPCFPGMVSTMRVDIGRLLFSVGAIVGFSLIYFYCTTDIFEKNTVSKMICISLAILFFMINSTMYIVITNESVLVNEIERKVGERIKNKIDEYERSTGIKVEKIVFNTDKKITYFYGLVKHQTFATLNAFHSEWSKLGTVNYHTNRKLEKIEDEKYTEYFKKQNWSSFDENQIILDGNVMYYCIY